MSTLKFNQWLNADNSENFKCRAWVDFNGTGTVAIRGSGGVTSITDNGVGEYTVNFNFTMPDTNFLVVPSVNSAVIVTSHNSRATTSCRINTSSSSSGTLVDPAVTGAAFFR